MILWREVASASLRLTFGVESLQDYHLGGGKVGECRAWRIESFFDIAFIAYFS